MSWTILPTRQPARAAERAAGHPVSQETVTKLLRAHGFSLPANPRTVEDGQHPARDTQFSHLHDRVNQFGETWGPGVSVDTTKKE